MTRFNLNYKEETLVMKRNKDIFKKKGEDLNQITIASDFSPQ